MAKNLRAKIAESDRMLIHDVNPAVTEKFKQEIGNVEIAKNVREVAENSVRDPIVRLAQTTHDDPILSYL